MVKLFGFQTGETPNDICIKYSYAMIKAVMLFSVCVWACDCYCSCSYAGVYFTYEVEE